MNTLLLSQFVPPPPDAGDAPMGEVCYENIGPKQRAIRSRFGTQAFVAALLLAAALLALDAAWFWRLLVFFPLAVAITNWLQARERT